MQPDGAVRKLWYGKMGGCNQLQHVLPQTFLNLCSTEARFTLTRLTAKRFQSLLASPHLCVVFVKEVFFLVISFSFVCMFVLSDMVSFELIENKSLHVIAIDD